MVKMIAIDKGYYGSMLIEPGTAFEVNRDDPKAPRWAKLARGAVAPEHWGVLPSPIDAEEELFGGKGDHDGDGKAGGAAKEKPVVKADWQSLKAADKRKLADEIAAFAGSGAKHSNAKDAEATIEAYLEANKGEVFGEAPEAEVVETKGNGLVDALGGAAPDWIDPASLGEAEASAD